MTEFKVPYEKLRERQGWDLDTKIVWSQEKIIEFAEAMDEQCYISFSGGKDSTVLLYLAREVYKDMPSVFCNTGMEYPEIQDFVKTIPDVTWMAPKVTPTWVWKNEGLPIVSKKVARMVRTIRDLRPETAATRHLYLTGYTAKGEYRSQFKIPDKWRPLISSPLKISETCCDHLKKEPFHRYEKETKRHPLIGTMASDGQRRERQYMHHGCVLLESKKPKAKPLMIWTEDDIWQYLREKRVPYSTIYDMGYKRTGCMGCGFGCHLNRPNRFQIMAKTHPNWYKHILDKMGMRQALDFIKVDYHPLPSIDDWLEAE